MATLSGNFWGAVLELDNDETNQVLAAADPLAALVGLGAAIVAIPAPQVGAILGIIAAAIVATKEVLALINQGNGLYLTAPWAAVWWGNPGLVIPTPR